MAKDREDRKKEKREKKEKKERKRREAEELAVREKKISKKHKSKSKESAATEKPEKKPKKKSKKLVAVEEKKKPHKKPHKKPDVSESESEEDPETVTTLPSNDLKHLLTTTTNNNESDSDFDLDKEDLKHLLETYTKEELVSLIHKTAEKNSRLIAAVFESAELDSSKRNIFVRGLGWDTTHETLKAAFEAYGEIEECSVVMDKDTGRAKGYGFVMFKTRKGCREALRNPEKRMFNRTVSCNLAAAKPAGAGKPREPVESVKIDLSQTQSEVVLPGPPPQGMDLGYGLDKGHKQQNVPPPMYGGQNMNMPFYPPPGYNHPMYAAAFMGNQMGPGGVPNFPMFGPGMMNHGPPNHMGMGGQFGGEGNGGVGPGFDGERAWYLR